MTRPTFLVAVSNGSVYMGYSSTSLTLTTNGSGALVDTPDMDMKDGPGSPNDGTAQSTHRHMYFCDGTNYKRLDAHTGEVVSWAAFNGTDAVTGETIAGSLPADGDGNKATIMAVWRGRIVLSGLTEDPHNWFMSAIGDPRNWDYSPPTPSATQAIAGNNADFGKTADPITALIPISDDLMIVGCDKSVWIMRGDPADGGTIDSLSRQIGIVGRDAWAMDPSGRVFFFGNDGLYMFDGGGLQRLSANRIERAFSEVDRANHRILLEWDRQRKGLYVFIVSDDSNTAAHTSYWWDERTDGFWPFKLPDGNGPTSVAIWDSDAVQDRVVLLGGRDGYVRAFRDLRPNDNDGESSGSSVESAIEAHCEIGPVSTQISQTLRVQEINFVLSGKSHDGSLILRSGKTPEAASSSTANRFKRTIKRGPNTATRQRVRNNSLVLRIEQTTADTLFSIEAIELVANPAGRQRAGR